MLAASGNRTHLVLSRWTTAAATGLPSLAASYDIWPENGLGLFYNVPGHIWGFCLSVTPENVSTFVSHHQQTETDRTDFLVSA